jgi:transposase
MVEKGKLPQRGCKQMPKPISNEKRADIVKHMQAGESKESISNWLFITVRTVERVWKRYQETGKYEAMPNCGGRKPLITDEQMSKVIEKVKEAPDMTLLELIEEFDLPFTESALHKRLKKQGLTYKKRHCTLTGENGKML